MDGKRYQRAFDAHRMLLLLGALYIVCVVAEALWMHVPVFELTHVFSFMLASFLLALIYLTGMYIGTFLVFFFQESVKARSVFEGRRRTLKRLDPIERDYISGDRLLWGGLAFLVSMADNFFFIVKSLIPYVNPFKNMRWDVTLAKVDAALHFGRHPAEILIPLVNAVPGAAHVLDVSYAFWLVVMVLMTGYNMFADPVIHRRLRFLWVHLLSWMIFGSLAATYFSSVGPLFYHDFFPDLPDPFALISTNLDKISSHSFFFAALARQKLLVWTTDDVLFQPNSLSSMPSMHVGIAWLLVLYAREINRRFFLFMALFFACIFLAVIYFGLHYAIDAYVMIPAVSLLWWGVGKALDKRYARDERLKGVAA
jgi:hypothetical protein